MTRSRRHRALLVLGVLLLTTPIWAPPLDVTGPDYQYSAALVTVEENRVDVPREPPRPRSVPSIGCFPAPSPSRLCGFESRLVGSPPVEAPYPGVRHIAGDPTLDAPERYVAFPDDGRVFERTTAWNASVGAYVLDLRRANATRVLEEASRPVGQYSSPVRRAVETGSSRAAEPLADPILVTLSGRYYAVYTTGTRSTLSEMPFTERVFELVAIVGGAGFLWRAKGTHSK